MTEAKVLARPLADRVALLPDVPELQDSPDPLPDTVAEAAEQALADDRIHTTDQAGVMRLRQWVASQMRLRHDVFMAADDVIITYGAAEARFICVKQLTQPGSKLYCPGDSSLIAAAAHLVGVEVVKTIEAPMAIHAVYLSLHDGKEDVEAVTPYIRNYGWRLIWDMRSGQDDFHPAQDESIAPHVVSIGSLDYRMPGWRVGWLAGHEQARSLRSLKERTMICSPSISQWAALGLVDAP